MVFFRKNKRQFGLRSHRRVFVAMFLLAFLGAAGISLLLGASAAEVPVKSVEIFSEHSNFTNDAPGSWKITKSAEWTEFGKARITFKVESIAKYDESKNLDVVMVIDNSGSMGGDKMVQVKPDATDLTNTILSNPNNRMSLVVFNSTASIISGFTNDKDAMLNYIDGISIAGATNYNQGLIKAQRVLDGYEEQSNRELILLFLTDGYPNEETMNEVAQYETLKTLYPDIIINGIQYEMGDTILDPIVRVSDHQYVANMYSLNNVLFEATIVPYVYDDFVITDYIDDTYWNVNNAYAISTKYGSASLDYEGSTPKITWDMSGIYRSGQTATLTIDVDIKDGILNSSDDDLLLPTNTHETIESKLDGNPDEDIDSRLTPVLKDKYEVIYDANKPSDCEVQGQVPGTESHTIFSSVEVYDNQLSCSGYKFMGWRVATPGVKYINDDYFRMPGEDVYIKAAWAKPSISKSMDGTTHHRATATFDAGQTVNVKLKKLSGQSSPTYSTTNNTITAIVKAEELSVMVDTADSAYIISASNSEVPIYAWFSSGTIYYYTDAEDVYLNANSGNMFSYLKALADVDTVSTWITKNVTSMAYMFSYSKFANLDAFSNWDTSKVTTFAGMFEYNTTLTDISGIAGWDASKATSTDHMFCGDTNLENFEALGGWDMSKVKNIDAMFYSTKIKNLDNLSGWNTVSLTDMGWAFANATSLENIDGASTWDTSKVTRMTYLFRGASNLTDISGASTWDTSKVKTMDYIFYNTKISDISVLSNWNVQSLTDLGNAFYGTNITNIDALSGWDMSHVTKMNSTFSNTKLTNVNGASGWDTSSLTTIASIFASSKNLTNISGLSGWNTSSVTNMSYAFGYTKITDVDALEDWDVSKVTTMSDLFYYTTSLVDISGLADWQTDALTDMSSMFWATSITDIDALADWDVSKVTTMSGLFSYADDLTNLDGSSSWDTSSLQNMGQMLGGTHSLHDIDALANWNTSNVTSMGSLFYYTSGPSDLTPISGWDTSKVTNMHSMFNLSSRITNLDPIQGWDTSSVTNMSEMFKDARGLTDIDGISGWDTSSVTNMSGMFSTSIIADVDALSGWDTSKVTNMSQMFYGAKNLADISGLSGWDTSKVTTIEKMFYNDNLITDLSPLNDWDTTSLTNKTDAFYNIPDSVARPSWY